jgi:hypothetical protein
MHAYRTTIICIGLIASIVQLAISQGSAISITSYDIDAIIAPRADAVQITATCAVQKTDTTMQTRLLLSSSCKLKAVQILGNSGWEGIPFQFVGKDTLQLGFKETQRQPARLSIKFTYAFPIGSLGDSLLLLDRGSRWYPLISDQIAKMRLICDVPGGYTVLSAGDLVERKASGAGSQFIWATQYPLFKLPLVVFKSSLFKKDSIQALNRKIVLYSSAADTFSTGSILAEAKNTFKFFSDEIGEYPHRCLTLVEVPYFDGVDVSSGLLMAGSSSLAGLRKRYWDPLQLTIAQQWMGAGVFAKFREPGFWFLTISLPHYLRLSYVRHTMGETAFDEALREPLKQYEQFAGKENDVPIIDVDFPNSREKGLVLYGKGPFVISKLHQQLGDTEWKALLKDLYRTYLGKILTYDEFRICVSRHDANGKGLSLLDKLMTRKGIPEDSM